MLALFTQIVIFIVLIFAVTKPALATISLTVSSLPSSMDQSNTMSAAVSLFCAGCSDSFLRGVFYPTGTSYFGFTQDNSSNWSNAPATSCTSYFKVATGDITPQGTWSGTLQFKLDQSSPYYNGPGEYLFKVGRYTSSCGSPTWSNESTIAITGPTPTPTPTMTPVPAPTNTPTPTQTPTATTKPTPSPTVTPLVTISPTSKLLSSPSATIDPSATDSGTDNLQILGVSTFATPSATPSPKNKTNVGVWALWIGIGMIVATCGILGVFYVRNKNLPHENE